MSEPGNPKNRRRSDINSWKKIEQRAKIEKKSECPALVFIDQ